MPVGDKTPKVRRDLMDACRILMRSLLISRENEGAEWTRRLRMAVKHVEDAARAVDPATADERQEIERIAGGLARLYMSNLLTEEERGYATKSIEEVPSLTAGGEELSGSSQVVPVPDLLSFLQMQGASGRMRVDTGEEVITLTFEQGDLTNAYSDNSPPGFRLGEILVELGDLDAERLQAFLSNFEPGREKLGDALQREGLISAEALRLALESQMRLIFLRLLCSENATYRFTRATSEDSGGPRFNVLQLLLDVSRIKDEAGTV